MDSRTLTFRLLLLCEEIELGIGGLKKLKKLVPAHLDKRGILAVTSASPYLPRHDILPGKGLPAGGLRAMRERYHPGLSPRKRKLQLVDGASGTQITITRPRKKVWNIESMSNPTTTRPIEVRGLVKAYGKEGFTVNHGKIRRALAKIPSATRSHSVPMTDQKVIDHAGGLPMIRRPRRS